LFNTQNQTPVIKEQLNELLEQYENFYSSLPKLTAELTEGFTGSVGYNAIKMAM